VLLFRVDRGAGAGAGPDMVDKPQRVLQAPQQQQVRASAHELLSLCRGMPCMPCMPCMGGAGRQSCAHLLAARTCLYMQQVACLALASHHGCMAVCCSKASAPGDA
jgi:hypothetical protein